MKKKQVTLTIPEDLATEFKRIAWREGITPVEVLQKFVKLGLTLDAIVTQGGEFQVRNPGSESFVTVNLWDRQERDE